MEFLVANLLSQKVSGLESMQKEKFVPAKGLKDRYMRNEGVYEGPKRPLDAESERHEGLLDRFVAA